MTGEEYEQWLSFAYAEQGYIVFAVAPGGSSHESGQVIPGINRGPEGALWAHPLRVTGETNLEDWLAQCRLLAAHHPTGPKTRVETIADSTYRFYRAEAD